MKNLSAFVKKSATLFAVWFRRRPMLASFLICSILLGSVSLFFEIRYQTIDDFFMNASSSGYIGGTPDEHLIYTHFIIGLVLKFFYQVTDSVNWHGAYLCLTHLASWTIILFGLSSMLRLRYSLFMFIYLFVTFQIYFFQNLQFTTTAALAALAGFTLFFSAWQGPVLNSKRFIAGIFIMLFAAMIRPDSVTLIIILSSPVALIHIKDYKKFLKIAAATAGVLAFTFVLPYIDKVYYYKDADWKVYYERRHTGIFVQTSAFHPMVVIAPDKPYRKIGWSDNDLRLFNSYFHEMPEIFSPDKVNQLEPYVKKSPFQLKTFLISTSRQLANIHLLLIFVSLLILVKFKNAYPGIISFLIALLILAYIFHFRLMKERVLFSMLICLCYWALFLLFNKAGSASAVPSRFPAIKRFYFTAFILIAGLLGLNSIKNQYLFNIRAIVPSKQLLKKQIAQLKKESFVYLTWGYVVNFEAAGPFDSEFRAGASPQIAPISAFAFSPILKSVFHSKDKNSFIEAFPDKRFRVVSTLDYDSASFYNGLSVSMLEALYREHYICSLQKNFEADYPELRFTINSFDGCK